ncbi:hypothetical protein LCGC14_1266310 [marine sediment metagenome]|uniref:Uncharacterized protein n=1 Tax=marine sediment metagenome TaxID=412755 RepID=A0A0F9L1E9_9ZZZZ
MIKLTPEQRDHLENLWFIYGNHGKKFTMSNHKFIQHFLEHGRDRRFFFKPDKELIELVDAILNKVDH